MSYSKTSLHSQFKSAAKKQARLKAEEAEGVRKDGRKIITPRGSKGGSKPVEPPKPNPLLEEARRFRAKRRFSQNFLIKASVVEGIVRALNLTGDLTGEDVVLEIGPGLGFLTHEILQKLGPEGRLTAVELERTMVSHLEKKLAPQIESQQLTVVSQDILAFDLAGFAVGVSPKKLKVVGNLPYNITSKVLFKLCGELTDPAYPLRDRLEQVTLMVQKEVGERLSAQPGHKAYNPLSIAVQVWFEVEPEFLVPADCFEPRPQVNSMVLSLFPRQQPLVKPSVLPMMDSLLRLSFQQRRKTLRNTLTQYEGLTEALLVKACHQAQVEMKARPEALSIAQWGALAEACSELLSK